MTVVLTRWRKKAQGKDVLSHLSQQYRQKFIMVALLPRKGKTKSWCTLRKKENQSPAK